MPKVLANTARVLILTLLIVVILGVFGLRVAHPNSGLRSALGEASSTLVIYKKGTDVEKEDRIIVDTGQRKSDPTLAVVNYIEDGSISLRVGTMLMRVENEAVYGKLLIVIPFLGYLIEPFDS